MQHEGKLALWQLFSYYKQYPTQRCISGTIYGILNEWRFIQQLRVWEEFLADRIDELSEHANERFLPERRIPHPCFSNYITGSIDVTVIIIQKPTGEWATMTYNGKYQDCVLKLQIFVDNTGRLVWYSGPHLGVTHDLELFRRFPPPLRPNEKLLADKAYIGGGPRLVCPCKRVKGQKQLSPLQRAYNDVHGFWRATIEHINAHIKKFQILLSYSGKIPSHSTYLFRAVKIIIHSLAVHIRSSPLRVLTPIPPPCNYSEEIEMEREIGNRRSFGTRRPSLHSMS